MIYQFEIYAISINWESPSTFRSYKLGAYPLKPKMSQNNNPEFDFVLYTKESADYYQFCIKTEGMPFIKSTDKNNISSFSNQLFNIDKDLWIIKEDWVIGQRGIGYHKCPSINTVGKIFIGINYDGINIQQELTIDVNPNIEDFDFNYLKKDFEGELWDLITLNKSKSNTQTHEIRYGDKVFRFTESKLIIDFLNEFNKIIKNPKRELIYVTTNQPYTKVKPIPSTFRKLASSGISTTLPSKYYKEHYNIYENRYLCLMLYKISQIVNYSTEFTNLQIKRLKTDINNKNKEIEELKNTPKLNELLLQQTIIEQQAQFHRLKKQWNDISNLLEIEATDIQKEVTINIKHADKSNYNYYWGDIDGNYSYFKLPDNLNKYIEEERIIKYNISYTLSCSIIKHKYNYITKSNKELPFYFINSITKIISVEVQRAFEIFKRQKENYIVLKENNFNQFSILSEQEKIKVENERRNQIETLKKHINKLRTQTEILTKKNAETTDLKTYINKYIHSNFFKSIDIQKPIKFKPSMTFIQNINYRNAQTYYHEILKSEGISIDVFGLFELITNYGVREIPQVYELWCLVSLIKVLNSLGYSHNSNDLHSLLSVITPDRKKIDKEVCINFSGNLNGRSIKLYYQKQLPNIKRPDFIIEIGTNSKTVNLILDSKFKNYNYKKSASIEAKNMYEKYGHYTFILHPTTDKTLNEKNIKLTNFGGDKIYDKDNNVDLPFHKYGFLMIKPNQTDNLKKIIGMSFEYLVENNHSAIGKNGRKDPKPELDLVCLNCASTIVIINKCTRGNDRYFYNCECQNKDCGHNIYIDYCWNCKTKLYKHGSYWDYHKTSIWSIFDIHCPSCGMTVADMPKVDLV